MSGNLSDSIRFVSTTFRPSIVSSHTNKPWNENEIWVGTGTSSRSRFENGWSQTLIPKNPKSPNLGKNFWTCFWALLLTLKRNFERILKKNFSKFWFTSFLSTQKHGQKIFPRFRLFGILGIKVWDQPFSKPEPVPVPTRISRTFLGLRSAKLWINYVDKLTWSCDKKNKLESNLVTCWTSILVQDCSSPEFVGQAKSPIFSVVYSWSLFSNFWIFIEPPISPCKM